jgi:hypothetical protein
MVGSLVFAYLYADSFEMYTKEFRLLADVLNNVALTIDAVSGFFPGLFLFTASVSTICKSCCGLLAGRCHKDKDCYWLFLLLVRISHFSFLRGQKTILMRLLGAS